MLSALAVDASLVVRIEGGSGLSSSIKSEGVNIYRFKVLRTNWGTGHFCVFDLTFLPLDKSCITLSSAAADFLAAT